MKSKRPIKKERRQRGKFLSAILVFAMVITMVNPMTVFAAGESQDSTEGGFLSKAIESVVDFFTGGDEGENAVEAYTVENAKTVSDPDTSNNWQNVLSSEGQASTKNIGRIWTDKTVTTDDYKFADGSPLDGKTISKDSNAEFLVGLSALSSTSNLKEMVQTSTPLDIVLVLDVSGSMDDNFGSYPNTQEKMQATKNAVNSFIDATAEANDEITDPNMRHEISVVKFAGTKSNDIGNDMNGYDIFGFFVPTENYSQRVSELNTYTTNTAQQLKSIVNELDPLGATRADYGMQLAETELDKNGREDAQQVVIFFTDGDPTSGNSFEASVANSAVTAAHTLKENGAQVYSVGIFTGASSTNMNSSSNQFMQAVSSNYPNATAYNNRGQRGEGDYYKTATDADELNSIFEEIFDETQESTGSGSPIEENTSAGAQNTPGYLTFTDTLGSYMEVSGNTMQLAYADKIYTSAEKTTEGNIDTYKFSGTVEGNAVYPNGNLADIVVTVTHSSNDLAVGDTVTVQIPASLIPMRNYDVDTGNNTMTVSSAYPVRLFYNVSLKEEAKNAVESGSGEVYSTIYGTNKSEDGSTIDFYSNLYNEGFGETTATFTPNDGNKFYYYTEDTFLYTDEACTKPATADNIGDVSTLYYKDTYWVATGSGNGAQEENAGVAIQRDGKEWNEMELNRGSAQYYIPAGTERADRPATLIANKSENITGTAGNVLTPTWASKGTVSQSLGNNGKMSVPASGELEITKIVDWGNASDETKQKQNSFEFTVDFNEDDALEGNFAYNIYETEEEPVSNGTVADGETITLKAGQRAVISGLPAGTTYTVTEAGANENGFTTTDQAAAGAENSDTNDGIVSGTIAGGSLQSVSFQNNYRADESLTVDTSDYLNVEKVLEGRDWRDSDEFRIDITKIDNNAPMPEKNSLTITDETENHKDSFGNIEFTTTGTFRYRIDEDNDTNPIPGISYSTDVYRMTVTIVDGGNGTLKVDSVVLERIQNDESIEEVKGNTATFTNIYQSDATTAVINGTKNYTDTTGGNEIDANKFTFKLEALGGYVTDAATDPVEYTISANQTPMPEGASENSITTGNVGDAFWFAEIPFDGNDVGNTYEYEITEVAGTEAGMSYDTDISYTVKITVTEEEDAEAGDGSVNIVATVDTPPEDIVFKNNYDPTDAVIEGDTAIHGTKTLTGRDMKHGEAFYFQLSAVNDNAKSVLPNDKTVNVDNPEDMRFNFGNLSFSKVGRYSFQVKEVDADGNTPENVDGMTFDTNTATITVDVSDNHNGTLSAKVTYANTSHGDITDQAVFENKYEASMNYGAEGKGGINVTKTIRDRSMANGDYSFTITGEGDAADLVTNADKNFTNTAAQVNGKSTMAKLQSLTFDETDAGKTYIFIVDEVMPADADKIAGVDYDQSEYRVSIEVVDNGDGTMHTLTTVTQIKDKDGNGTDKVLVDHANSDEQSYEVPAIPFTNDYNPTPAELVSDAETGLRVEKTVTGAPSPYGVEYSFTLTARNTAEGPAANIEGLNEKDQLHVSTSGTIEEGKSQIVPFDKLTFTEPGTYTFTVQEDEPEPYDGWTFDTSEKTVTVVVSDRNDQGQFDGALHIRSVTNNGLVEITNRYKPGAIVVGVEDAEEQMTVQKSVTGRDSEAEFTFRLEPVVKQGEEAKWENVERVDENWDGTVMIDGVTTDAPETANFGALTFSATGEYQFKVTEAGAEDFNQGDDRKGWTYDDHASYITVTITDDDHDGRLEAAVSYDNSNATAEDDKSETDVAAFTNVYQPAKTSLKGSDALTVTKVLEGRDWQEGDSFTFTLTGADDVTKNAITDKDIVLPDNAVGLTITNDTEGHKAYFGDIVFKKAGHYVFDITEIKPEEGALENVTYDIAPHVVMVDVTDNGDGTMKVEVTEGANPTITNTYTEPEAGTTVLDKLNGTKVLEGGELGKAQFFFSVTPLNGAPMGKTNATGNPNGVDSDDLSSITLLKDITYTEADLNGQDSRDFQYIITEEIPSEGNRTPGLTYDDSAYRVTVTVENTDGTLTASEPKIEKGSWDGTTFTKDEDQTGVEGIVFTNSYGVEETTFTPIEVTKVLEGDRPEPLRDGEFEFEMSVVSADPTDGVELPNKTKISNDSDGKVQFGDITFTKAGTYTLQIKEVVPEDKDEHMEYSENVLESTFTVEEQNGKLVVVRTDSEGETTFVNTYDSDGEYDAVLEGAGNMEVTKKLENRDWKDGDRFTFTLAAHGAETQAAVDSGIVILPENAKGLVIDSQTEGHKSAFGNIRFTEPGDYYFDITEKKGDDPYLTYDTSAHLVAVHVEQVNEDDTHLTAKVTEGVNPTITNTYEPTEQGQVAEDQFGLKKTFTGKKWTEDYEFTFTISPVEGTLESGIHLDADDVPMPDEKTVTVNAPDKESEDTATFGFGPIRYDEAGTYVYEVSENAGANEGIDYAGNTAKVTVTVTDNKNGGFSTAVNVKDGTFTNTYHTDLIYDDPDVTTDGLNVVKELKGHDMTAGQFEFTLTAADEASAKKAGIEDGLTKTFTNSTATHDEEGVSTDTMYPLSGMEFTQEDSGNTYSYTISEKNAGVKGYTYDSDEYTVTIKVSDDGKGTLTAETTVTNGEDYTVSETVTNHMNGSAAVKVPFTNTYNATGTLGGDGEGAVKINATKELTNRDQVAGEFKFNVTNSKEENGKPVTTGTNAADGTVTFNPIEYTTEGMLEDVANGIAVAGKTEDGNDTYTYQYTVAEDESSFDDGVTAIEASFQITVTVTDNNDGTLSIAVTYPEGSNDNLTFRNAYGAGEDGTAVLNIKGAKDLDVESGNNAPDIAGKYTFELSGSEGAPMPDNTTATNDAAGNVSFGDITYTMENVFGEAASDDSSVSEDQTAEPKTPAADEAVDGNEGGSAEDTADVPADETDGTEAEAADETGSAEAEVDAQSADEAVQPEAEQQDAGEATGDSVQTTSVEPAMTGNDGIAALSTVRQKTFTYTVTETGSVAGVTNDAEASKTFDVTVTDNGDGTLSVTTSEVPGGLFKFTNTYSVTPTDPTDPTNPDDSGEAAVTITKELAGRDMTEGEFSFVLKDANGETVSETKNAADGSVKFTGITFDTPGSYSYTISEVQGNAGGVTYDSTIYKATATVTDNSDGTLSAVWSVTDADGNAVDSIVFHNEYSYSGTTTVTLGATKALDGRAMEEGEFNFLLKDSDGETVAKAANSKDGAVQFDELSFDKPGTYEYTISEEKGDDATITYDDTVYNVTVTVADSGEGYLTASVDFGGETPAFTNVYTAPEEPTEEPAKPADNSNKGETPKADKIQKEEPAKTTTVQTGDSSPIMMTVIVMAAAFVAIIAAIVVMFRRRNGR